MVRRWWSCSQVPRNPHDSRDDGHRGSWWGQLAKVRCSATSRWRGRFLQRFGTFRLAHIVGLHCSSAEPCGMSSTYRKPETNLPIDHFLHFKSPWRRRQICKWRRRNPAQMHNQPGRGVSSCSADVGIWPHQRGFKARHALSLQHLVTWSPILTESLDGDTPWPSL